MTVGQFKRHLDGIPDEWEITFGQFVFERVKKRGAELVNVEFSPLVYWDPDAEVWQVVGAPDGPTWLKNDGGSP